MWRDIAILLLPPSLLVLLDRLMLHMSIRPNPFLHSSLWGVVGGVIMSYLAFRRGIRCGKLGRLGSSVALGLFAGLFLFLFSLAFRL